MADALAAAPTDARPHMSAWQQASLSLYWFATNAHWGAILITLLPLQARLIGGAEAQGGTLGTILLIGAFVSMIAAPLFGAWSDRIRTRWGRRTPFLVVGTIGNVVGLLALASDVLPNAHDYAKDMGVWHIAFTLPQVVATPIAGLLLDNFQRIGQAGGRPNLGYSVIFALALGYFALGTVLVKQVKGAR